MSRDDEMLKEALAFMEQGVRSHLSVCESPIERMMMLAIATMPAFAWALPGNSVNGGIVGTMWDRELVYAQHRVNCGGALYRLDFAIITQKQKVAIECDGHDFHERTKEQAARDKSRDRVLVAAGWKVLRFTGSEIYRNPYKCADQIGAIIWGERDEAAS